MPWFVRLLQFFFRRQGWSDLSVLVRRSHKDKRARKALLSLLFGIVWLIAFCTYEGGLLYMLHDRDTEIAVAIVLMLILVIVAAVRVRDHLDSKKMAEEDLASVPRETVARVQRLAHGLAAATERAMGELWLTRNTVPEGSTIVSRQISLQSLRSHGAWDEMPLKARDWLVRPDGTWPEVRIHLVLQSAEILNTLLWAIGLIPRLRANENLLEPLDFKKLARQLEKPAPGIRPTWDLRPERNTAHLYFLRCYAERVSRGEIQAQDERQKESFDAWLAEIAERPEEDFLARAQTVRELSQESLYTATRSVAGRLQTLNFLMSLLDGEDVWDEFTQATYISLLLQAGEHADNESQ